MKSLLRLLLVTSVVLLLGRPVLAAATEAEITVERGQNEVVLDVRGWRSSDAAPRLRRGHLEVFLEDGPTYMQVTQIDDPTVTRATLVGGSKPRLIVVLDGDRKQVAALTSIATVEPREDGFRVTVPRKLPAPPPAPAQPVARQNELAVQTATGTTAELSPAANAPAVATATATSTEPLPLLPAQSTTESSKAWPASTQPAPSPSLGIIGVILVGLCAAGAFFAWKKRNAAGPSAPNPFRIVSSQNIGGRARIALLAAGNRRLLVGVSERGVQLLDRWDDANEGVSTELSLAARELADTWHRSGESHANLEVPQRPDLNIATIGAAAESSHTSPSVAGIVRLRREQAATYDLARLQAAAGGETLR